MIPDMPHGAYSGSSRPRPSPSRRSVLRARAAVLLAVPPLADLPHAARAEGQPLEPPVSCPPTCAAVRRLRASIATDGAFEPRAPSPPGEQDEVACCAARDGRLSALGAIVHAARVCLPSRETRHSRLWKRPLVPERSLGGAPQRCLTCLSLSSLNATCAQERAAGRRPSSYS